MSSRNFAGKRYGKTKPLNHQAKRETKNNQTLVLKCAQMEEGTIGFSKRGSGSQYLM